MHIFPWITKSAEHRRVRYGQVVECGALTITPFLVDHGPTAPGAAGFVARHGLRKIVFTGDLLRIPDVDNPLLSRPDVCFLESNTWHPAQSTGHLSITEGFELLRIWQPQRTYLIHYSGFEDRQYPHEKINGPLSLDRLQHDAQLAVPDLEIGVARHGMVLGADVEWPSE